MRSFSCFSVLLPVGWAILLSVAPPAWGQIAELTNFSDSPVYDVAVQGTIAYLSQGPHLTVVDVSSPNTPSVIGRVRLPIESTSRSIVRNIAVADSRAYIADGAQGVWILDVSSPTAPVLRGSYSFPESTRTRAVAAAGSFVYVAGGFSGLQILDVGDPAAPELVTSFSTPGFANSVAVMDSLVLVVGSAGMLIVDVSTPEAPVPRGSLDTPVRDVAVSGELAYVTHGGGLSVVDILGPARPVLLGTAATPGSADAVAVSGSLALVADGWEALAIVDVSQSSEPVLLGSFDMGGFPHMWNRADTVIGYIPGVAAVGSRVYLANTFDNPGLKVIDVSDPSAAVPLGFYDAPSNPFGNVMEELIRVGLPVGLVAAPVALVILVRRRRRIAPVSRERATRFGLSFWAYWILATAFGMGAGMGLGWLLGSGLRSPAAVAAGKGLPWLVVGLIQWYMLRREVSVTVWWTGAYAIGGAVVALFAFVIGWSLGDIPAAAGLVIGGTCGLIVGTVQWAVWRRRLSLTIEWVGVSAVGWASGLGAGFLSVHGLGWAGSSGDAGPAVQAAAGAIAGTVGGALTGIALVWLLRHPLPEALGESHSARGAEQ